MPGWQRTYLVACGVIIGFALAYVLCDFSALPRLTYYPYERHWRVVARPAGEVPMFYVGTVLWGLGGAVCGGLLIQGACRFVNRPVAERWLLLAGAWALAAFAYAGLYYTWNLWPF
jgi:hypothetical protein